MSSIDTLRAAIDVGFASEQGDIDIADDLLKSAAFMVAVASAAIYFALSELGRSGGAQVFTSWQTVVILVSILSFAGSIFLAVRVHANHTRFRALCRNMIVARKLLLAELIEKIEAVEAVTKESAVPLWALVTSGQIAEHIASAAASSFPQTQAKQVAARTALDQVHRFQRLLVLFGFFLLLVALTIMIQSLAPEHESRAMGDDVRVGEGGREVD